jgi:hypothetical protein
LTDFAKRLDAFVEKLTVDFGLLDSLRKSRDLEVRPVVPEKFLIFVFDFFIPNS